MTGRAGSRGRHRRLVRNTSLSWSGHGSLQPDRALYVIERLAEREAATPTIVQHRMWLLDVANEAKRWDIIRDTSATASACQDEIEEGWALFEKRLRVEGLI